MNQSNWKYLNIVINLKYIFTSVSLFMKKTYLLGISAMYLYPFSIVISNEKKIVNNLSNS